MLLLSYNTYFTNNNMSFASVRKKLYFMKIKTNYWTLASQISACEICPFVGFVASYRQHEIVIQLTEHVLMSAWAPEAEEMRSEQAYSSCVSAPLMMSPPSQWNVCVKPILTPGLEQMFPLQQGQGRGHSHTNDSSLSFITQHFLDHYPQSHTTVAWIFTGPLPTLQ